MIIIYWSLILLLVGYIIASVVYYKKQRESYEQKLYDKVTEANKQKEQMKQMQRPINVDMPVQQQKKKLYWMENGNIVVRCYNCGDERSFTGGTIRTSLQMAGWLMNNDRPYCPHCKKIIFPDRYKSKEDSSTTDTPTLPDESTDNITVEPTEFT